MSEQVTGSPDEIPAPDDYIRMPWSRPRHPHTGLDEKNAVVCHWLTPVGRSRIIRAIGRVPNQELDEIGEALRRLFDRAE